MESLRLHLQDIICKDREHTYSPIFNSHNNYPPAFIGALLADSIFPSLRRYVEILNATEEQYSPKTEFDRLLYVAEMLDITVPRLLPIEKWREFGNPSVNVTDFANVARIQDSYAPAQHRASIKRKQALHAHLKNIHILLNTCKGIMYQPGDSSLKAFFLFYVIHWAFQLVNTHIVEEHAGEQPFCAIYDFFTEEPTEKSNNCDSVHNLRISSRLQEVENMIDDAKAQLSTETCFSLSRDIHLLDNQERFWSDLFAWDYLQSFLKCTQLKQCLDYLLEKYDSYTCETSTVRNEYDGNLQYIKDIYPRMLKDNNQYRDEIRNRENISKDDIIYEESLHPRNEFIAEKLFSNSKNKVEFNNALIKTKQQLIEEMDVDKKMIRFKEYKDGLWNNNLRIMQNPFLSFDFIQIIPEEIHNHLFCPLLIYKLQIKHFEILAEIIKRELNLVSNDMVAWSKGEKTLGENRRKKMENILGELLAPHLDCSNQGTEPNSNKSIIFPYVKAMSIEEWKNFFLKFCHIKETDIPPCLFPLNCESEEKEKCYKAFLIHLREIFIKDMKEYP